MIPVRGDYVVLFGEHPERRVEAWDETGHPMIVGSQGLVRADAVACPIGIETRELRPITNAAGGAGALELELPQACLETATLTGSEMRLMELHGIPGMAAGRRVDLTCRMQMGHTGCHAAVADGTEYDPVELYDSWLLWGAPTPREKAEHLDYEGGPFRLRTVAGNCSAGRPLADGSQLACTLKSGHDGAHSHELAGYVPRRRDIWHRPAPRKSAIP